MKKATLNYVIDTPSGPKFYILETAPLYYIDNFTAQYSSDDDLIENYYNKDKIQDIMNKTGVKGKLKISYVTDLSKREILPPLYNSQEEIFLKDDFLNGKNSEIERARRLLFNSKNQLFAKMAFGCNSISDSLANRISVTYEEYKHLAKSGVDIEEYNDKLYVDFKELVKYRANNRKLTSIRGLYEDMLDIWKEKLFALDEDELYYYSRQLRLLYNLYNSIKTKRVSIGNLQVSPISVDTMKEYALSRKTYKNARKINTIRGKRKLKEAA